MNKISTQNLVILGEIVKPHGLLGEVKARIYNPSSEILSEGKIVWLVGDDKLKKQFTVEKVGLPSPKLILKFMSISNKEEARRIVGAKISIEREKLPKLGKDENYLVDLVGLQVFNEEEEFLGKVTDILSLPANDVLVVKQSEKEILIPIIDEIVKLIDFENKKMIIHQMEGLLL